LKESIDMASQRTKFAVGLFLTCGLLFFVLVIIWLGMSRFLEEGRHYVTYFDESVQGLSIDAPVKYRGVFIGRVESIGVAPDSKLIQVVLKIESKQVLDSSIVAQLKSVGITGSMFIELDRKKEGEPDQSPKLNFPAEYPILASKPSEIGTLISGINEALGQIKSLNLQAIAEQFKLTLENINLKVAQANVKGISDRIEASVKKLDALLQDRKWNSILDLMDKGVRSFNTVISNADGSLDRVNKTLERVDGIVLDNKQTINAAIADLRLAMQHANLLMQKGSNLVDGTDETVSQLMHRMLIVAQNLERASENLNQIMEILAEQPSQLIFGAPPQSRKVEPELEKR
jgi:phospholipid/cholesterol/gamma-HCH transport system substrate-binding protein